MTPASATLKKLGDARVYISFLAAISELAVPFSKVNEEHGSTHKLPLAIRNRRCDAPANCVDGNDFTLVRGCVIKEGYTLPLQQLRGSMKTVPFACSCASRDHGCAAFDLGKAGFAAVKKTPMHKLDAHRSKGAYRFLASVLPLCGCSFASRNGSPFHREFLPHHAVK